MFKALMKTYTGQCLYRPIGGKLTTGKYESIQGYLSGIFNTLQLYGQDYSVK